MPLTRTFSTMNDQHYKQRMDFVEFILQSNGLQVRLCLFKD